VSDIEIIVYGEPGPQGSNWPRFDSKTGRFLPRHGMFGTVEYNAWRSMIKRCYCQTNASFHRYGGRGISVLERWRTSFASFFEDMGNRPSSLHSLDRIDNDGNYEPSNCRWATAKVQQSNRRSVVLLEFNGERLPLSDWSSRSLISRSTISQRLSNGWTVADALTTPVDKRRASK